MARQPVQQQDHGGNVEQRDRIDRPPARRRHFFCVLWHSRRGLRGILRLVWQSPFHSRLPVSFQTATYQTTLSSRLVRDQEASSTCPPPGGRTSTPNARQQPSPQLPDALPPAERQPRSKLVSRQPVSPLGQNSNNFAGNFFTSNLSLSKKKPFPDYRF